MGCGASTEMKEVPIQAPASSVQDTPAPSNNANIAAESQHFRESPQVARRGKQLDTGSLTEDESLLGTESEAQVCVEATIRSPAQQREKEVRRAKKPAGRPLPESTGEESLDKDVWDNDDWVKPEPASYPALDDLHLRDAAFGDIGRRCACPECGRKFAPERLDAHIALAHKNKANRKPFDIQAQRMLPEQKKAMEKAIKKSSKNAQEERENKERRSSKSQGRDEREDRQRRREEKGKGKNRAERKHRS